MTDLAPWLSAEARAAVERAVARPLSYGIRLLTSPGEPRRLIVVAGEAHLKLRRASEIGRQLVGAFELRGVESFPRERVVAGRALKLLIEAPRFLIRLLSGGLVRDSTIRAARQAASGRVFLLESVSRIPLALHVATIHMAAFFAVMFAVTLALPFQAWIPDRVLEPLAIVTLVLSCHLVGLIPALLLRRRRWSWLIHPWVAILAARDTMMAEGTVRMLAENPQPLSALVIMGRGHCPGYERELVEKYGFSRLP